MQAARPSGGGRELDRRAFREDEAQRHVPGDATPDRARAKVAPPVPGLGVPLAWPGVADGHVDGRRDLLVQLVGLVPAAVGVLAAVVAGRVELQPHHLVGEPFGMGGEGLRPAREGDEEGGRVTGVQDGLPLVEQRIELNGTILLRPAGEPILHTGDAPAFFITLPRGTQAFTAHAEWLPDQVMGLEFHPPGDYGGENANRSWDKAHQLNQQVAPPIDMAIGHPAPGQWHPEPGDWWCYLGPSTVGGGVSWNMTLRFILPEGSAVKLTPSS